MKKRYSIKKNEDIQQILNSGAFYTNRELIMYVKKNGTNKNNVAFLAGKKLGNAPLRNAVKRKMRMAMQKSWPRIALGNDIVIIARPMILEKNPEIIQNSLENLLKRHRIVSDY